MNEVLVIVTVAPGRAAHELERQLHGQFASYRSLDGRAPISVALS